MFEMARIIIYKNKRNSNVFCCSRNNFPIPCMMLKTVRIAMYSTNGEIFRVQGKIKQVSRHEKRMHASMDKIFGYYMITEYLGPRTI